MTDQITTSRADEDDTWVELPGSEDFEHDGEPVGSDDDLDELGYDPGDDPASQPPPVPPPPAPDGGGRGDNLKFSVSKAAIPSWVQQHGNGEIPLDAMIKVAPISSGYLVPEAAAAWRNLQNAASAAGFTLTMTGAYRTYDQQKSLFADRYTTSDTGRKSKVWTGTTYWLKAGMAMAAVPGTSNHGWGCAVDAALGGYGNAAEPVREPFLSWALTEARRHGWSWEVQSEPWHLRLVSFESAAAPEPAVTSESAEPATTPQQPPVPPPPTLKRGDKGGQVAALQGICTLFRWGDCGRSDGTFGPRTEDAVKAMQGALGVDADGRYGPKSSAALGAFMTAMATSR